MSLDSARAAIDKIRTDGSFRQQLLSITDPAKRIEHLNRSGFLCTMAEIQQLTTPDLGFDLKCGEMVMPLTCPDVKA